MNSKNLESRFTWRDVVADDKWAGWGWMQTCTVATGRVNIECIPQPALGGDRCMRLCVIALDQTTLIEYTDSGFVLREYVARLPIDAVIERLLQVPSTPVHLVAPELLKSLSNDGLLTQLFGNQRRGRGQLTH
ncbi:hypothetical protein [Laribacter hongkongensis]|uniref:Uncharacterized protein n=1 Tax=Laribacter hongkongensis TaxID=168471 RepID=A0A248LEZ2_9NEIS|nr:hypothetical protein [Laribacter hongkongensis]ASJ23182.1 hypothetical protein LHGZ1_0351 [Laribacter hongkongensis]MCG9087761.1 hypothetical protein [Laribacter hongkongensis]MCG9108196.1 hypothetical protein [Laribacter hongkongensis]MCG9120320.1 hypothetical protein [Laribacter hongkongensis]